MKQHIILGQLTLSLMAALGTPYWKAYAIENDNDFSFISPLVEEAILNKKAGDTSLTQIDIASAQVRTAQTSHFPNFLLNSSLGVAKNSTYANGKQTNSKDKATNSADISVSASERLWNLGQDSLTIEASKTKVDAAQFDNKVSHIKLQSGILTDLLAMLNLQKKLSQKEKELSQWKYLNDSNYKKAKSGLLGARDTLQSDKELLSAQGDISLIKNSINVQLSLFNKKYKLENTKIQASDFAKFEEKFSAALRGFTFICEDNFQTLAQKSVDLEKLRYQKAAADQEMQLRQKQILNPDLRLSADVGASYIDNINKPSLPQTTYPSVAMNSSIGLKFSMNVFSPKSIYFGAEQEEQLKQLKASTNATSDDLLNLCRKFETDQKNIMLQIENAKKVLGKTDEIVQGNNKLFNAGFIDVFQVVKGMQDLYALETNLTEYENQYRNNLLAIRIAQTFGYFSSKEVSQ